MSMCRNRPLPLNGDNVSPEGVLRKHYTGPAPDKQRLRQIMDLVRNSRLGDARSADVLRRIYAPYGNSAGTFGQSVEFIRAHARADCFYMVHSVYPEG